MAQEIGRTSASSNLDIQNSLCLIDRLPTETLEVIFIQCARDYYRTGIPECIPTPPRWVNVSYVSRHWRFVALNCPTLWSYLFITSRRWTEELLTRSQQASLKLNVNLFRSDKKVADFVGQIANHLERVQEFTLLLSSFESHQLLPKLSSRAPRLQHLSLSFHYHPSEWTPASLLFDGDTPALRTVQLSCCPVPWYSLNLSGLTSLSLGYVPAHLQQDMTKFLATLSGMQALTRLDLDKALASAARFLSSTAFLHFHKVELPHLCWLRVTAPHSTIVAILSCVNIPLQTEIRLALDLDDEHIPSRIDNFALALCSPLAQRFASSEAQTPPSSPIRSLIIARAEPGAANVTFSTSERGLDAFTEVHEVEWDRSVPLQICIPSGQTKPNDRDHIISLISCPLPLLYVQSLHAFNPPLSLHFWTYVLERLQDLRRLKLSYGHMPDLASLLSLAPRDGWVDGGRHQIFAPELEELELCGIMISTELEGNMDPIEHPNIRSLCDALSTRTKTRGRLTMTRCIYVQFVTRRVFDMTGRWEEGRFHVDGHRHDSNTL